MQNVENAQHKIDCALRAIADLRASDFPYIDPRNALDDLKKLLNREKENLQNIDPDDDQNIVFDRCLRASSHVMEVLEACGFRAVQFSL